MCISNGFRWNVPVVTYGFDQSLLNFFGTNGVAAVQGAIEILNALPPASQMVLSNFPYYSKQQNYSASSQGVYDLKSQALSLVVEQMGLAKPTPSIYVLRRWDPIFVTSGFFDGYEYLFPQTNWVNGILGYNIIRRNYDPQTLGPTPVVNQDFFDAELVTSLKWGSFIGIIGPVGVIGQSSPPYGAVADQTLNPGEIFLGLTYDDVGGLRYLLSTNNINYETLLPDVIGVGTNSGSLVNRAWRPGVEKITFVQQATDPQTGAFVKMTNCYTDNYITNGVLMQQQVARITLRPDFLFSASNLISTSGFCPLYSRSGTGNWSNNAAPNGNSDGTGPGVIQPPVQITFNRLSQLYGNGSSEDQINGSSSTWASFDNSTNSPIIYPTTQLGTSQMTFHLWIGHPDGTEIKSFDWNPVSATGSQYTFQTSTNLANWTTLFGVTNDGALHSYFNSSPVSAARYYRLVPQ